MFNPLRQGLKAIGGITNASSALAYLTVTISIPGLVYLGYRYLNWNFEAERKVRRVWKTTHVDRDDEDDDCVVSTSGSSRITRITVDYVRCEVGLLSDTKANRIVVSELVRKFLKNRGVRPSHISRLFLTIVEAYFLMSPDDLLVIEMRRTSFAGKWRRGGEIG